MLNEECSYQDDNCGACSGTWPRCTMCGWTLDFYNGDDYYDINCIEIHDVGLRCDGVDDNGDWSHRLCLKCAAVVDSFIAVEKMKRSINKEDYVAEWCKLWCYKCMHLGIALTCDNCGCGSDRNDVPDLFEEKP